MRWLLEGWRRFRATRWGRWAIELAFVLFVVAGVTAWQTRAHLGSGAPAPDFLLRDLDGREVQLSDFRGKPLLVSFWAPWCGVCKQESSNLDAVRDATQGAAHVVTIVLDYPSLKSVKRYVEQRKARYPVLLGDSEVGEAYAVTSFPTSYFIEPDGRVSGTVVGYTTTFGLRARLWWAGL